jgi:hypothetical protein
MFISCSLPVALANLTINMQLHSLQGSGVGKALYASKNTRSRTAVSIGGGGVSIGGGGGGGGDGQASASAAAAAADAMEGVSGDAQLFARTFVVDGDHVRDGVAVMGRAKDYILFSIPVGKASV